MLSKLGFNTEIYSSVNVENTSEEFTFVLFTEEVGVGKGISYLRILGSK